ncbi:hypothetical protein DL768_005872 [Monosporascus sp. mg162]|nr:hypothetical protein DL768_005872 [Monosporascus sp. mg162]
MASVYWFDRVERGPSVAYNISADPCDKHDTPKRARDIVYTAAGPSTLGRDLRVHPLALADYGRKTCITSAARLPESAAQVSQSDAAVPIPDWEPAGVPGKPMFNKELCTFVVLMCDVAVNGYGEHVLSSFVLSGRSGYSKISAATR